MNLIELVKNNEWQFYITAYKNTEYATIIENEYSKKEIILKLVRDLKREDYLIYIIENSRMQLITSIKIPIALPIKEATQFFNKYISLELFT